MGNRRYLTGLDWMIHALDSATRRVCPTGNHSQTILELERALDPHQLESDLQSFASAFPLLNGRVARSWILEPYWKVPRNTKSVSIRLQIHCPVESEVFNVLRECLNTPFRHAREYVVFHYLHLPEGRSRLAMVFDHRLLDARGAELFLAMFSSHAAGDLSQEQMDRASVPVQSSLLNNWRKRFSSGRSMLRSMRAYNDCKVATLVDGEAGGDTSFIHLLLDESESKRFLDRAYREAGFLMFMPYALSLAVRIFSDLCLQIGRKGDLIIPCTTDLRGIDARSEKIFFNYCSMLFFRAGESELQEHSKLISSLKMQFYDQSKDRFPEHFENVMVLMRILPIRLFDWLICNRMKHCFGSFSFASLGTDSFEDGKFCNVRVQNLFHMPHVPPQVGIGFVFNTFQGKINVGVSFCDTLFDEATRERVSARLMKLCQSSDELPPVQDTCPYFRAFHR